MGHLSDGAEWFVVATHHDSMPENTGEIHVLSDETAVWIEPIGRTCVTLRGAKEVALHSTGQEKLRITVMLCARANGAKCRPSVLLPRKRSIPEIKLRFKNTHSWCDKKLILSWCGSTWMNDRIPQQSSGEVFIFEPTVGLGFSPSTYLARNQS